MGDGAAGGTGHGEAGVEIEAGRRAGGVGLAEAFSDMLGGLLGGSRTTERNSGPGLCFLERISV